jgi:hypothetical protein
MCFWRLAASQRAWVIVRDATTCLGKAVSSKNPRENGLYSRFSRGKHAIDGALMGPMDSSASRLDIIPKWDLYNHFFG